MRKASLIMLGLIVATVIPEAIIAQVPHDPLAMANELRTMVERSNPEKEIILDFFPEEEIINDVCSHLGVEKTDIIPETGMISLAGIETENEVSIAFLLVIVNKDNPPGDILVHLEAENSFEFDTAFDKVNGFLGDVEDYHREKSDKDEGRSVWWRQVGNYYQATYRQYPYGEVGLTTFLSLAVGDGYSDKKFCVVNPRFVSTPGRIIWGGNRFINIYTYDHIDVDGCSQNYHLVSWGPPTTPNTSSYTVSLGYPGGINFSYTRSTLQASFEDWSVMGDDDSKTVVRYGFNSPASKTTFTYQPGALFYVPESYWYFQGNMYFGTAFMDWLIPSNNCFIYLSRYWYGQE